MVIDLRFIRPQCVLISVNEDLHKRYQEVEHQPVVHHFDAAGLGQTLADSNKHGGQDQHDLIMHLEILLFSF